MKKQLHYILDFIVFLLAVTGSLMAFGIGAMIIFIQSSFKRTNPIKTTAPALTRIKNLLSFIYRNFIYRN